MSMPTTNTIMQGTITPMPTQAALAKLSAEDRALAETQKVCIVAKEPLGSMGAPIKVEHNGQVAFLCCDGCREAFEADPEKYLAALADGAEAAAVPEPAATEPAPTADPAAEAPAEGT
jgi:YHS domain-containing protein